MYELNQSTSPDYSPWSLLPAPEPRTESPPDGYFYDKVAKHLVKDTVRIMLNGLPIDLEKVRELEAVLDKVLQQVSDTLKSNSIVQRYQSERYSQMVKDYKAERMSKCRTLDYYRTEFDPSKMEHRSYFMHIFAEQNNLPSPDDKLPTGVSKWTARQVKTFASTRMILQRLIEKNISESNSDIARQAMDLLAQHKCDIHNRKYLDQVAKPVIDFPEFNPASPDQKSAIFTDMLGFESDKLTDSYKEYEKKLRTAQRYGTPLPEVPKNKYSWDRDNIENVMKSTDDPDLIELCQALVDHSFGAIVRNNFIKAFYEYSIKHDDGYRLHGTLRLFGAKSFRLTSQNPNLLNVPSTGSVYAKPIKQCFTAPPGYVVLTADFSALEDKVMASISRDRNKIITQTDKELDGHLFHATIYFRDKFVALLGDLPHRELTIAAKAEMEAGNKEIKNLRQLSKGITFGASYGAFPPKIAQQIKCSLEEAEQIFNAYHNDMYPEITKYRETYVLPTAKQLGKLHLGLGCYIRSEKPDRDIRTLSNATIQYWSILTLLAINEMHRRIDEAGLQNDVICTSTIYDSVYYVTKRDPQTIKWVNDNLIECMVKDFMPDQTVPNDSACEIGPSWADLTEIPNSASIEQIQQILDKF